MKKTLIFVLFIIISISTFSQDFQNPVDYLNYINTRQQNIEKEMWDYARTFAHSNRQGKIIRNRKQFIQSIQTAIDEISKMPAFKGKTDLRDSIVEHLKMYYNLVNGQYTELEKLEEKSTESYQAMMKFIQKQDEINKKISDDGKRISVLYNNFAKDNNLEVTETNDEISAKITLSNIVLRYYQKLYLYRFKMQIYNTKMIESANKMDSLSTHRYLDTLKQVISEVNQALRKVNAYNGDLTLKFTCQKSVQNFKLIAENYMPTILKFIDIYNEYERNKKIIDNTPKNKLTQEQINSYNSIVEKYNNQLNQYNKKIKEIQKIMQTEQKQWNDAVDKFLDKNIPK